MRIWIDADACPSPIKDLVVRTAHRKRIDTVFVANKPILLPESPHLSAVQVSGGPDIADDYISEHAESGDLCVTQDIPLAARLVPRQIAVLSPRGYSFTAENINEALSNRDLMQSLRDTGTVTGGPKPFDEKLKRQFANRLDALLTQLTARD